MNSIKKNSQPTELEFIDKESDNEPIPGLTFFPPYLGFNDKMNLY